MINNSVFYKESVKILLISKRVSEVPRTNSGRNYWTRDFFDFLNPEGAHGEKHKICIMKTSIISKTVLRLSIPNRWGVMHLTFPISKLN